MIRAGELSLPVPGRLNGDSLLLVHTMWHNDRGKQVDPVPFLFTSLLAFMLAFSFVPVYAVQAGFDRTAGLVASGVLTVAASGYAYYRLIWKARPELRDEIPLEIWLQRLFYAIIAGVILILALTVPIVTSR